MIHLQNLGYPQGGAKGQICRTMREMSNLYKQSPPYIASLQAKEREKQAKKTAREISREAKKILTSVKKSQAKPKRTRKPKQMTAKQLSDLLKQRELGAGCCGYGGILELYDDDEISDISNLHSNTNIDPRLLEFSGGNPWRDFLKQNKRCDPIFGPERRPQRMSEWLQFSRNLKEGQSDTYKGRMYTRQRGKVRKI